MKKCPFFAILLAILSLSPLCAWGADMGTIESGEVRTGTLISPSFTDTWTFSGNAGDRVVITVSSGSVQPEIFLYPPDSGPSEASATGTSHCKTLDHQLLQTGLYTILIRDWLMDNAGDYGIALAKIPGAATSVIDPDGGGIASGETLTGTMDALADTDIFQFYGYAGDRVIITISSGSVQPEVFLYPPDSGPCEASATGTSHCKTLDHQLLQTGLYTILIRDWLMDNTGGYRIALAKIPGAATSVTDPDGGGVASGETLSGTMDAWGDTDIVQFYGDAGDRVIITASSGSVQPEFFLYPPDSGPCEASATGTSHCKTLDHQLSQTGLYTILIRDWLMDNTGGYRIALAKIPGAATSIMDPDGGAVASGETLTGTMDAWGDTDIFQFYGDAGDRVIITSSSGSVRPEIFLYPPDSGPCEASATGTSSSKTVDHQLSQTGLYTILIRDWLMDNTGGYGMSLTKIPGTLRPGVYNPYPENGATVRNRHASFQWDPVTGVTGYDVYFGEDVIEALNKIGNDLSSPSMPFPPMALDTVYYWHVVAHTPGGDIQGPYWWFKVDIRVHESLPWIPLLLLFGD